MKFFITSPSEGYHDTLFVAEDPRQFSLKLREATHLYNGVTTRDLDRFRFVFLSGIGPINFEEIYNLSRLPEYTEFSIGEESITAKYIPALLSIFEAKFDMAGNFLRHEVSCVDGVMFYSLIRVH